MSLVTISNSFSNLNNMEKPLMPTFGVSKKALFDFSKLPNVHFNKLIFTIYD